MATGNWNDILDEYKDLIKHSAKHPLWKRFIWMEKLIPHLLSNRDLSELYPVTSHNVLNLSFSKNYHYKPHISINVNRSLRAELRHEYKYEVSLTHYREDGNIWRRNIESVFCSFEKSLEVFDELYEKLKALSK